MGTYGSYGASIARDRPSKAIGYRSYRLPRNACGSASRRRRFRLACPAPLQGRQQALDLTAASEILGDAEILLDEAMVPPTLGAENLPHQGEVALDVGQEGVTSAGAIGG